MFKVNNNTVEHRCGDYIVNFEYILDLFLLWIYFRPFSTVAIVHYEQVNVCLGVVSHVNVITQSI